MWIAKVESHLESMGLMGQPYPTWVGNNHKKIDYWYYFPHISPIS